MTRSPFVKSPRGGQSTLVLAVVAVATLLGPLLLYTQKHLGVESSPATPPEAAAVLSLRRLVGELQDLARALPANGSGGESSSAGSSGPQLEELRAQFVNLRADLERQVQQLVAAGPGGGQQQQQQQQQRLQHLEVAAGGGGGGPEGGLWLGKPPRAGSSNGSSDNGNSSGGPATTLTRIGEDPVTIAFLDGQADQGHYLASPSIVKLRSGRLLAVYEKALPWGTGDTWQKTVAASDDGGATWRNVSTVGPMNWPQIFRCKSGVYIIGTQRHFSYNNNLVISRMMAPNGVAWSRPVLLTQGWSVVAANTGVDVSNGKVTKTFEIIPGMAWPLTTTQILKEVAIQVEGGPQGSSWYHQPVVDVEVENTSGFVQYTLVKVPVGERALFFRVLEVLPGERRLRLRLERFNLYWQQEPVTIPWNATLEAASGAYVYGGVDWVAMAMSADESADLTRPGAWTFADPPLGNPASIYSNEMRALFDVAFRADQEVRSSIIGFDVPGMGEDPQTAWEAGFGSVYWMEGVITRVQDKHGGNGKLLSIMRVNNDLLCDLAAVLEFDDSQAGKLEGRFLRYTFVPGLGVGHPAIVYDEDSDLYWMAGNVNRDATRKWKNPATPTDAEPALHITPFSKCEVDRSTLALFYSPNLLNWVLAGVVDYTQTLARHFAYPHMTVDGADLLIVTRAAMARGARSENKPLDQFYNNHNSNAIALHRVRGFRRYANAAWANEQGPYSELPRRTSTLEDLARDAQRQREEALAAAAEAGRHRPVNTERIDRWRERMRERGLGRWAEAEARQREAAAQAAAAQQQEQQQQQQQQAERGQEQQQ